MTNDKPLYVYYDQGVPIRMYRWLTVPAKNCYIFIGTPCMKVHSTYWLLSLVIARVNCTLIRGWDHTTQLKTSIVSLWPIIFQLVWTIRDLPQPLIPFPLSLGSVTGWA